MSTRRDVLKLAAAGVAARQGRSASTTGRIDCQSHLFSEEFLKLLEKRKSSPYVERVGNDRYVVIRDWRR
ncbi:MAG TPA: hypothetical protein VNV86_15970, partial [Candidatus Acidoferrum sp.]|nr:hypothetical protein [Candidatus Acidoferrum sp.]